MTQILSHFTRQVLGLE